MENAEVFIVKVLTKCLNNKYCSESRQLSKISAIILISNTSIKYREIALNINQPEQLTEIMKIARSVAWGAADILSSYYHGKGEDKELDVQDKKDGPVTQADLAANHYILENLQSKLGKEDFGVVKDSAKCATHHD